MYWIMSHSIVVQAIIQSVIVDSYMQMCVNIFMACKYFMYNGYRIQEVEQIVNDNACWFNFLLHGNAEVTMKWINIYSRQYTIWLSRYLVDR